MMEYTLELVCDHRTSLSKRHKTTISKISWLINPYTMVTCCTTSSSHRKSRLVRFVHQPSLLHKHDYDPVTWTTATSKAETEINISVFTWLIMVDLDMKFNCQWSRLILGYTQLLEPFYFLISESSPPLHFITWRLHGYSGWYWHYNFSIFLVDLHTKSCWCDLMEKNFTAWTTSFLVPNIWPS